MFYKIFFSLDYKNCRLFMYYNNKFICNICRIMAFGVLLLMFLINIVVIGGFFFFLF